MSKLICPYPSQKYDENFLPDACWWRIAMIDRNENGYLYVVTRNGQYDWSDCTWVQWEWFDGQDRIIDGGMDKPEIAALSMIYIEPIEYLDLLMEYKPTARAYRITEYGDRKHPGVKVIPDLDRESNSRFG